MLQSAASFGTFQGRHLGWPNGETDNLSPLGNPIVRVRQHDSASGPGLCNTSSVYWVLQVAEQTAMHWCVT